jgi:hypothetical protein
MNISKKYTPVERFFISWLLKSLRRKMGDLHIRSSGTHTRNHRNQVTPTAATSHIRLKARKSKAETEVL